jgi:hypothetical protein
MNRISVFTSGKPVKEFSGVLERKEDDVLQARPIRGKFEEPAEILLELIDPVSKGLSQTSIDGKRYKLADLMPDGTFLAVPDFK